MRLTQVKVQKELYRKINIVNEQTADIDIIHDLSHHSFKLTRLVIQLFSAIKKAYIAVSLFYSIGADGETRTLTT